MHPPCELMMDTFLPAMRGLVAERLHREGLSQGRIAGLLGVTQPSVSSYLSAPRGKYAKMLLLALGVSEEDASTFAALLAEDLKKNPVYAVETLYSIWSDLLGRGRACTQHRADYPALSSCEVCMKVFRPGRGRGEKAIEHVQSAVRRVEGSALFVKVMPEISVNLAFAEADASSLEDVVAIPGRIVRAKGQARSFMKPEYGASTHLAAILLEMRRAHRPGGAAATTATAKFGAAMNLRYDARMREVIDGKMRLRTLVIGETYPEGYRDKVLGALRAGLESAADRRPEQVDAVVDLGGAGVEPSLYIFAEDATKVVELALEIARQYVETH